MPSATSLLTLPPSLLLRCLLLHIDMVHSQHFGDAIRNLVVWRYLVLDEGHKVKNEETLISQVWGEVWGWGQVQGEGVALPGVGQGAQGYK